MYTAGKKYAAFVLINCLTLSRIPLSVFAYMEITAGTIRGIYYLCLFLGIAVSDFLDGKCARAFHVQSSFGAIADVICDFFYVMTSSYEHPPVVRRTAPSNTRIKLTAKLKSLTAFSLLAAYPPPR